ncbi:MAG: flagellar hook protein FlgE [Candidatus Rokubacteria bacterium]|nr:flagellar hook protein FlgE [Candidatus Rokubacteria bacterium]
MAAIETAFTQGEISATNNATDLALQGDGFFVVKNNGASYYTRAGSFTLDANGTLVDTVSGYQVQGLAGNITIVSGSMSPGNPTTNEFFGGNLDATSAVGANYTSTFSLNDSLGSPHSLTVTFTKAAAAGTWNWATATTDPNIASLGAGSSGSIVFGPTGAITAGASSAMVVNYIAAAGVTTPQTVTLDWGTAANTSPVTGYASTSTVALTSQDGFAAGSLRSFSISADGSVIGNYSNGRSVNLAQVELATFANPGGLSKTGNNLYTETVNSGTPNLGAPGTSGRGTLIPGSLEGSNVDLAREFTELIQAQRGFEANARVIKAGDELLQTVVNIKQ